MRRTPSLAAVKREITIMAILYIVALTAVIVFAICNLGHRLMTYKTKVYRMKDGVGYVIPQRATADPNKYPGGRSVGPGWQITWKGPYNAGLTPIEAMRATLDNLTHMQKTNDMASTANAKLMVHLIKGIEEYDGVAPTMGGELNDLIPKGDK